MSLPPGWKKKESHSQPGRFYYVSPEGKTRWMPPVNKQTLRKIYQWNMEITISFDSGRLGVALSEMNAIGKHPEFPVEVEDLPKLPNNWPGPAEVYNYSVQKEKRLRPGMRIVAINEECLAGLAYPEVIEKLKRTPRPVKIKFADVTKGLIGEAIPESTLDSNMDPNSDQGASRSVNDRVKLLEKKASLSGSDMDKNENNNFNRELKKQPSSYINSAFSLQNRVSTQFKTFCLTSELLSLGWTITWKELAQKDQILKIKYDILSKHYKDVYDDFMKNKKEEQTLQQQEDECIAQLDKLQKQEKGELESEEKIRHTKLTERNAKLNQDIQKLIASNKRLRKDREALQRSVEEAESKLEKTIASSGSGGAIDKTKEGDDSSKGSGHEGSMEMQLSAFKEKLRILNEHIEEEKVWSQKLQGKEAKVKSQLISLQRKVRKLEEHTKVESSRKKVLEHKKEELSTQLHETVTKLAVATRIGNRSLIEEFSQRRSELKSDIRGIQDELEILRRQKEEEKIHQTSTKELARREIQNVDKQLETNRNREEKKLQHQTNDSSSNNRRKSNRKDERDLLNQKSNSRSLSDVKQEQHQSNESDVNNGRTPSRKEDKDLLNQKSNSRATSEGKSLPHQSSESSLTSGRRSSRKDEKELFNKKGNIRVPPEAGADGITSMKAESPSIDVRKTENHGKVRDNDKKTSNSLEKDKSSSSASKKASHHYFRSSSSSKKQSDAGASSFGRSSSGLSLSNSDLGTSSGLSRSLSNRPIPEAESRRPQYHRSTSDIDPHNRLPVMSGILDKCPTASNDTHGRTSFVNNIKTMRGARERYCVLGKDGVLLYFKRKGDTQPRGKIDLTLETMEIIRGDEKKFDFVLCTKLHQSRFVARNKDDWNAWINAIQTSITLLNDRKKRKDSISSSATVSSHDRGDDRKRSISKKKESEEDDLRATLGF